jgi:sarcosine oxidase subunit alpha
MTGFRLATGGRIDRSQTLPFRWDGKRMRGHPGDTLASALIANGERLVARSFKYHRPRGIFAAGSEEPSALVTVGEGAHATPNTRATTLPLTEGLVATSQNWRGALRFDLMSVNDALGPFLTAGFYYKTFMWPAAFWERLYEPAIRASAGMGALSGAADPDAYAQGWRHADLLVIGAGPAGLMAALVAGRAGLSVILADEDTDAGGRLASETLEIGGAPGALWGDETAAELAAMPNVRVMPRTTVFGVYDAGEYGALERGTDARGIRSVLWRIRARHAVLAAGATERGLALAGNDRPGVMLAGAVRSYLNRYGVAPGARVAVMGAGGAAARTARDLAAAGVEVVTEVDAASRDRIVDTRGRQGLHTVITKRGKRLPADILALSGGWTPNVQLTCHHRNRPVWRDDIAAFVPGRDLPPGMICAGAVTGALTLADALREGAEAGAQVAEAVGRRAPRVNLPEAEDDPAGGAAIWHLPGGRGRAFVDLQHDVTVKDIGQAKQEGFEAVEHLKRYTTLGMATDQGRAAGATGVALMAQLRGIPVGEAGTTMYRPPYTPVPVGALGGAHRGRDFQPVRRTPTHDWAAAQGAVFTEAGLWLRAQYFPREGETHWRESVDREVIATRRGVGLCDVSTLGKIEVQGRDAAAFLNFVYCNGMGKLAPGRVRYGLMLREDGFVYDDGTCAHLGEGRYVVTTTTANAGGVFQHMEFVRQCLMPEADVHLVSTTDAWAQIAVAGPMARALLSCVIAEDISDAAVPFMACGEVTVGGVRGRLFRITFSGELAYEVAVPARYGHALMEALWQAGQPYDVVAYGTEALGVMRIEKGHAAGGELNGQTTARDLGMGGMVSSRKDSVGAVLSRRPALTEPDRPTLVGLVPERAGDEIGAGAHLLAPGAKAETAADEGWVSAAAFSPTLGHAIALGFLKRGPDRHGERMIAWDGMRGRHVPVRVTSPHFYDPEGARARV